MTSVVFNQKVTPGSFWESQGTPAKRIYWAAEPKGKRQGKKGVILKVLYSKKYFPLLHGTCLKKHPKWHPNTSSAFSSSAVTIPYENQVRTYSEDLKHTIWVSSSLRHCYYCYAAGASRFGSNIPVIIGSEVGSNNHAEDTLQSKSTQLWVESGLVPRITRIMS